MAKDPVCGMDVDEKNAVATAEYKGKTWGMNYEQGNLRVALSPRVTEV